MSRIAGGRFLADSEKARLRKYLAALCSGYRDSSL
jgi:hypothetical protein